jgi:Ca2+-binding EF-hand superfamily protein
MRYAAPISTLALIAAASAAPAAATSYEEAIAQFEARFAKADANKDGKLTKQEAKDGEMTRLSRFFGRVDSDGDGFVTKAQLKARIDERYDK